MLGEERQNKILRIIEEKNSITVQELMKLLDASESTVRRDLNFLDDEGLIVKVHGGALAREKGLGTVDADMATRMNLNREEKIAIAKYAASIIENGDVVYIDAGTTTEIIPDFVSVKNVLFVTNAFSHAKKLSQAGYMTHILGGEFKGLTEAVVGEEAIMALERYNFTKGFFGANGISIKNGFTTPDIKEAMVKRKAMEKTKNRYVLCDRSKFSQVSAITFAEFDSAKIITDRISDSAYKGYNNITEVN